VFSECAVEAALDAAHVAPYAGLQTNRTSNGLPLRADIHKLFDRHLVSLEWANGRLIRHVSTALAGTEYAGFAGPIQPPKDFEHRPALDAVAQHFAAFKTGAV
jgi:hypothetical protein